MRNIDTRVIDNFLSDKEVETIEKFVMTTIDPVDSYHEGDHPRGKPGEKYLYANYYNFDFYNQDNKIIHDILAPKFAEHFGADLFMQQIHIFNSVNPYNIHTDYDHSNLRANPVDSDPAWTFIIPLDTFDSNTIVFEQESENNIPQDYMDAHPLKQPGKYHITEETRQKYFSHIPMGDFQWFSIEKIFPWTKGSLFAASRKKFHTSDNFLANGLKYKRAIVSWTTLPKQK